MMTDRTKAIIDLKNAVADIMNLGTEGLSDEGKIRLAEVLLNDATSIRLVVSLEPFAIVAGVFAEDGKTPPVKLFEVYDAQHRETSH